MSFRNNKNGNSSATSDDSRRQNGNGKELSSWKEIGEYLGVQARTAQRWETEKGLPIKRYPGIKGRVSASTTALDKWKQDNAKERSSAFNTSPSNLLALLVIVLIVAGAIFGLAYWLNHRPGAPASFHPEKNILIVVDRQGRERWRYPFPDMLFPGRYADPIIATEKVSWFGDVDGDSETETLFVYFPAGHEKVGSTLYCFDKDGAVKWQWKPGREVADRDRSYDSLYSIANLAVMDIDRDNCQEILVTSHHLMGAPNQFAVLNNAGQPKSEYWHPGQLHHLGIADLDNDGWPEILLAGINNGYKQATLVVLDPRRIAGASGVPDGDLNQLQGFQPADEEWVLLFPRTCINQKLGQYNGVHNLIISNNAIKIEIREILDVPPSPDLVIYEFNREMEILHVTFSDALKSRHRTLQAEGKLDHPYDDKEQEALRQSLVYLKRPKASPATGPAQSSKP